VILRLPGKSIILGQPALGEKNAKNRKRPAS
jgi:hypothetical protein